MPTYGKVCIGNGVYSNLVFQKCLVFGVIISKGEREKSAGGRIRIKASIF